MLTRRALLRAGACAPAAFHIPRAAKPSDIRIEEVRFGYAGYEYRTPIKFGGTLLDRVTLINVTCRVGSRVGNSAAGFGSMPLGNTWSFPSRTMSYATTLDAMKILAGRIRSLTVGLKEFGHPIDLNVALQPHYLRAAEEVSRELRLDTPIPKLCTEVTASAFDAAIHDAFGKLHGRGSYLTYGRDFMTHDLSRYLGSAFKGEYLDRYVSNTPKSRMPLYHLVGAADPISEGDIRNRVGDGLPETLPQWIRYNGLTHLKIKLNGDDLAWDVERILRVERAASETQASRGVKRWFYSLDFNEKCANVEYLLEFLRRVRSSAPAAFDRIQYVEQPTHRDLKSHRANTMHEASRLRPVVIDESLTDHESLLLAREMGYTGAALKTCKQHSRALLMAAAARKLDMFLCVQDLTCPGASLIHSAGLAAHIRHVHAIEANARQYVPAANRPWEDRFPEFFRISDGTMRTGVLKGPGLSALPPEATPIS